MNCYGGMQREGRELAGILEYLSSVEKFIRENGPAIKLLIISGGMDAGNNQKEADAIQEELQRRLGNLMPVTLSNYSTSTISIVESAFQIVRGMGVKSVLVFICDKPRKLKVKWLADHFSRELYFRVIAFRRRDNWKTTLLRSNRFAQMIELRLIKRNLEMMRQNIERGR